MAEDGEYIEISENEMQDASDYSGSEHEEDLSGSENGQWEQQQDGADGEEAGVALDRKLHDFAPHDTEPVYSVDVHPTERTLLVTGGGDDCARLIRYEHMTEEVAEVAVLGSNTDSVIAVKFSTDGKLVASACMDGAVKIYDGLTGAPVQVLEGPNEVVWIDWHPKGPVIAAGAEDGMVWMWNALSGQCMQVFSGNALRSIAGLFSPDGKWLVTSGEGIVFVWNPKEGKAEIIYDRAQGLPITESEIISLAVNPASTLIAAGSADGHVSILHLTHQEVVKHLDAHTDAVEGLAFSPKLNFLLSAGLDARVIVWDLKSFAVRIQCANAAEDGVTSARWIADPDTFITSSVTGVVTVWDGRSGAKLDQVGLKDVPCLAVAPVPSNQLLFCAYDNGRLLSFAYN